MIWGYHYFRKHPCRVLFQVIQNEVLSKETPKEETKKDDSDSSDEKPKKKTSDSHGPQILLEISNIPLEHTKKTLNPTCLRRKSFHICILGYLGYVPGVCWDFLRQMSSLFLFFFRTFVLKKKASNLVGF